MIPGYRYRYAQNPSYRTDTDIPNIPHTEPISISPISPIPNPYCYRFIPIFFIQIPIPGIGTQYLVSYRVSVELYPKQSNQHSNSPFTNSCITITISPFTIRSIPCSHFSNHYNVVQLATTWNRNNPPVGELCGEENSTRRFSLWGLKSVLNAAFFL